MATSADLAPPLSAVALAIKRGQNAAPSFTFVSPMPSSIPPELASLRRRSSSQGDAIAWLGQVDNISDLDRLGNGEWTTLYEFENNDAGSRCFYSALMTVTRVSDALKNDSWELKIGDSRPGFTKYRQEGHDLTKYERFGLEGIELIVYSREFHGIKPRQFDISEEFRLFHNLYHDRPNAIFISMIVATRL
jgi:hypothetical protein